MWVLIMTFAVLTAVCYLIYFDRHVRASAARHLSTVVAITEPRQSWTTRSRRRRLLRRVVGRTSSRIQALAVVTLLFVVCWYPLHLLTVVDASFQLPFKVSERSLHDHSFIHSKFNKNRQNAVTQ